MGDRLKILILLTVVALTSISCAHNIKKSISEIKPGMTRSDVVDKAGSPLYVKRGTAEHIWVYKYYDKDSEQWVKKAVFWKNNVVKSVGDAPPEKVVLENDPVKSKEEMTKEKLGLTRGTIKDTPPIGSEKWYQDIQEMEKEQIKMEKKKIVPTYQEIN